MKLYKIELNGKPFTLSGLTNEVKDEICDVVQVDAERGWMRRCRKGMYQDGEALLFRPKKLPFASEEVLNYTMSEAGAKRFYKAMLAGPEGYVVTDEDVEALYRAQSDVNSEIGTICRLMFEDAYPKKKTETPTIPPSSTATQTDGGPY